MSLGALPWVIFAVVGRNAGQGTAWASAAALVTVVVVSVPMLRWRRLRLLQASAIILFSALLVLGLLAGDDRTAFINLYSRALAFGGFAITAYVSLFFVPFTEEYTRDAVRPRYWATPRFRSVNFFMSAIVAVAFTFMTASFVIAQVIGTSLTNTLFNFIVPIVIGVSVRLYAQTRWNNYYDEHVSAADDALQHIAVLDTLFMAPARETQRESS